MNYVSLFSDFKTYIVMFPHDTFDPVINSVFIHKCFLRTYKVSGIVLSGRNISVSKKHPTLWFSYLMISPKSSLSIVWVYIFFHCYILFCFGMLKSTLPLNVLGFPSLIFFFFNWSNAWKLHLICQWATYFTAYGGYVMCLIWANLHIFLIKLHISLLTFALFQR